MSRNIILGQYIPGESLIHRLNPRLKIVILVLILAALFLVQSFSGLLVLFLCLLGLIAAAKIPPGYFVRGLRPVLYIALFALIVYFFFTRGGVVLLRVGALTLESEGVFGGLFIVARLILLVLFSLLLTLTTTPLSLTHGLGSFLRPLRRLGLPAEEITMIMALSLRFIPTLIEESGRLMRAQVSRGANFSEGSIFRRAGNLVPLVVPLFVSAFRRADELALAMEARGYRLGAERTRIYEDKIMARDWAALAAAVALLAAVLGFGL